MFKIQQLRANWYKMADWLICIFGAKSNLKSAIQGKRSKSTRKPVNGIVRE